MSMNDEFERLMAEVRKHRDAWSDAEANLAQWQRDHDKARAEELGLPTEPGWYLNVSDNTMMRIAVDGRWTDGFDYEYSVEELEGATFYPVVIVTEAK